MICPTLEELFIAVQKEKLKLSEISLHTLIDQNRDELTLENKAAPFIAIFAHLIYLKSLQLLPQESNEQEEIEEASLFVDPEEYSSFKEAAKTFSTKEREQSAHYLRNLNVPQEQFPRQEPMIELGIEEFSRLFSEVWKQAQERFSTISEEEWKVADALAELRSALLHDRILFQDLFSPEYSKERLIVTFLATLELMKNQEAHLIQLSGEWYICIP